MTSISLERALEETEKRGEVFAAIARVIIAVVMLLAAWLSHETGQTSHPLMMVAFLYTFSSLIGVVLAYARAFNPIIPYVFVAIDAFVVALALTMLARMHNLSLAHEFSLPLFSLSFVILTHAALRYRPTLILAGYLLFLIFLFLFPLAINLFEMPIMMMNENSAWHTAGAVVDAALHDVGFLPLLFLSLTAALLFYIVQRTRSLAELAIIDGRRATQLSQFFSPQVAENLGSDAFTDLRAGKRQHVAVLFIDIRGFSEKAETLTPDEVAEFLSAFRTKICEVVFRHDGTVDKFIGDAVLAVFGTPSTRPDDALRAVKAAIDIRDEINDWHLCRQQEGLPCAKVGIGGHFGEVFSGIIEAGEILEHSVIGDTVNVAERLERLTRHYQSDFVFSDQLLTASKVQIDLQSEEAVEIRGHTSRIKIWFG